jgi:hypothetical protein
MSSARPGRFVLPQDDRKRLAELHYAVIISIFH